MALSIKPTGTQQAGRSTGPVASAPPSNGAASGIQEDTVTVTPQAERIQQLEQSLAAMPSVDTQRVESLKLALASGQYQVDSGKIADKLLQMDQDLLP